MKQSVFAFGVRVDDSVRDALQTVERDLRHIEWVDSVEVEGPISSATIRIQTSFKHGEAAKKLHRKIMHALMKANGLTITSATSNLTEVFG